jgi:hypothetical protein
MSDMRKLLESMYKFAGEPKQKAGDQVRGTEKANKENPFKHRLVGETDDHCSVCDRPSKDCVCDEELKESLMAEYKFFIEQPTANVAPAGNTTSPTPTQTAAGGAPGPGGQTTTTTTTAGQQPATGTPPAGQPPAATGTAPTGQQPGQPAPAGQPPAGGVKPTGAAGSMTPPNPQQIKKDTEALNKVMNNPMSPLNKELQALIKKAALLPK